MATVEWGCKKCEKSMVVNPDGSRNPDLMMSRDKDGDNEMVCPHCRARHAYTREIKGGRVRYWLKKDQ